jgi:hypothetical protein
MIFWLVLAPILVYLGLAVALKVFQHRLVYVPSSAWEATPDEFHLPWEDVTFQAADGVRLSAWFIPHPEARGTVLVCHGNAGNISHRIETAAMWRELGMSVLLLDYRGYGRSEGTPSEEGTYRDAQAAWAYLTGERGVAPDRLIIHGRSLGGAVAAHLAGAHPQAAGVVIESAFASIPKMGARMYPVFPEWLLRRLADHGYDTLAHVGRVRCPLLVVHGRQDELVPVEQGRLIYQAACEPKGIVEIDGGHNDAFLVSVDDYLSALREFVDDCLPATGQASEMGG